MRHPEWARKDAMESKSHLSAEDPPHFTPQDWAAYFARTHGLSPDQMQVPPLVIGTFQHVVWGRLLQRTAADTEAAWPRYEHRLARGSIGGRAVQVARLMIGAPAAVIMMEELIACGARRFLFVGTAGSLQPSLPIGAVALAATAEREEGTSFHYLPAGATPRASPALLAALHRSAMGRGHDLPSGAVWTIDAPYRELSSKVARYAEQGVLAVEMEAAALFAVAEFRGVEAALILAMSDELFHPWHPGFHAEELNQGILEALEVALDAVASL
jgi:uridine phosphorylase